MTLGVEEQGTRSPDAAHNAGQPPWVAQYIMSCTHMRYGAVPSRLCITKADQGASFGRRVRARALPRQTKARALVRIHRFAQPVDADDWFLQKVGPTAAVDAGKAQGAQIGATSISVSIGAS